MGVSLSATAAIIGVSLAIILQAFTASIPMKISEISNANSEMKNRVLEQCQTDLDITNITDVGWWDSDWAYRKMIVIDHAKIQADQTDFPVLIYREADLDLAAHAQPDGDDIVFVNDDNSIKFNHEIEKYNNTIGEITAWVKIPALSANQDTIIYMYYGNLGCSNQQDISNTWDSNFRMVQHLNESLGTLYDSTSNNNDGTNNGALYNASSKIDGGHDFDGSDYVSCDDSNSLDITNQITLEGWVKDPLPFLSSQKQNIIKIFDKKQINITKAEYLDEKRDFLKDIYEYVKEKDNNWSEPINDGEYVRVTFEEPLNKSNYITIFVRSSGAAQIKVYTQNNDTLITKFDRVTGENFYKVYLTNLINKCSTFDFQTVGGPVEYDFIVDPESKNAVDSNTANMDGSADKGTETNFANCQDTTPDTDVMTIQEADQGGIKTIGFVSAGAGTSGTGTSFNVPYPSSITAGYLLLLQCQVCDLSGGAVNTPADWTLMYGPNATGSDDGGRQWIFYKFASGSESENLAVTTAASTLVKGFRMYQFSNVTSTNFYGWGGFETRSSSTIQDVGVTTPTNGCMALNFIFIGEDGGSCSSFTGETGGDWTEVISSYQTSIGTDLEIHVQAALLSSAGTINGGTYSYGQSDPYGVVGFYLKPSPAVNYNIDFEYNWTTADFDEDYEKVCFYVTSHTGSENLNVNYWSGSSWTNLGQITSTGWTNLTAAGLTDATYEIQLVGASESGDGSQDSWNIDVIMLHTWSRPSSSVDTISPYWQKNSPLTITATATDTGIGGLKNVTLYYYNSTNNNTWKGPWKYGVDTDPWIAISWSFNFPNGTGYYRFYSIAYDNATNQEAFTGNDTMCGYDNQAPTSTVDTITPYWKTSSPQTITSTASDTGPSGLNNVTLWYKYRATNTSGWGGWTNSGLVDTDPWVAVSWSFNFPNGTGHYEFYSIARDNLTNVESAPGSADARCAYDTPPASYVNTILPYWQKISPFMITGTASDGLTGLKNVTLWYRWSRNNISWDGGKNETINYVDSNTSDVDDVSDIGTHSNFTNQQSAPDNIYDTLTETVNGSFDTQYAESLGVSSYSADTNWQTKATITINPSTASSYLILATAGIRVASTTVNIGARLTVAGSTCQEVRYMPKDTTDWYPFVALKVINISSSTTVNLDYMTYTAGTAVTIREARIIALKVPYAAYDEDEARTTTTSNSWQTRSSISVTPDGASENFIVIATANLDGSLNSESARARIYNSDGTTITDYIEEPGVATNAKMTFGSISRVTLTQTRTISLDYCSETSMTTGIQYSHIVAIPESAFNNIYYSSNDAEVSPAAPSTWYTKVSNVYTPIAGDHLIIGMCQDRCQATGSSSAFRLTYNGTNDNGYLKEDKDTTDYRSSFTMTRSTLTATQKTDSIDYQAEATTADFKNARLFSIELTPPACKLDLEENWTNVDYSQKYEELCIKTGEMGDEKLRVDVWTGTWVNLMTDLTGSAWNNISVSDYLDSDTFTIRFTGSNESSDMIRDTWQIDAVLLHTWNDTDNVSSRNWSIWSNANNPDTDPWIAISWNYNFPNETGYYQFYSIATDNATNIESAPGSADASCYYNPSPTQANEGPPNSSIKINITPPLNVTVDDDETLTAYWLSNSSGMWKLFGTNNSIDTSSGAVNIIQTNINFSSWGTTYWWSVNVTDGTSWSNVTYHFTTNFLSNITNPSPANESSNQNIKPICNITVSDEDGGTVDVFFYENTTGVWKLQQTNNSVDVTTPVNVIWNNYSNATLYSTTYWWKVNVTDDKGVSIEEIYHFTTSYPPTLSNPYPENGSNSVPISPVCTITISDNDGGTVTVKIFENTTGVWKLQQTNNSVDVTTPATVIWNNYSNASEFNTPYWWKVNVTDGTGRSSEGIYHFTTAQGNPPIQSAENPTDASTNIPITITTINVTIEDLDGDSLDWTIETNPDIGSSSGFNEGNGSKICTVSGLTYGTTYTWYVNATDGIDWSNETYTFTTSYRPELSNPGPSNGSSEQNLTPACNITVSDIDGGTVNVSFYENTTGIWKLQQTNTSIDVTAPANVVWTIYTNATQRNTTYWWKINVTDNDGNSREEIYHFTTTKGNPPQIALVNPSPNGTANVAILPSCQIWANDTDGDTLTVYWYENSTGSYQLRATYNNNVSANSITGYIFSEFSDYSKTYYWKVVVNESYYNTTATYYFTTEVNNPPEISNPSPTNGSTNIAPIPWTNITITDTEEDIMTITWYSNSSGSWVQYGSNTSCSNGTYRQLNSNFSDYSKTYWWNVTVNDGKETNKSWYYFTTGVIQTSVDTISPYEQTTSPLTVNATGGSVLDNVTLYYRYTTDNITVFQPSYKNAGTGSAGIGSSLTPGYPSGLAGNDFMILQLMVLGNSGAPNTPAGWELKFGPDATGSNDGYCWVYYTYATGDESGSLTVDGLPGTGGKFARIYSFENVSLTDPFDSSTGWETSTGSTISDVDVTTSIDKEYAVNLVNVGEDANTYVDFAGETGGDWIELVAQYSNAAGNDGTLQIQGATMPTAGTIYGGTFSMGASDPAGVRGFALMPRTVEWTVWSDGSNPDTASPWSWEFDFPNSTGYYEFYSIGKKTGSADELAPQTADTKCNYTQIGTLPAVITNVSTGVEETNATLWGYLQNNGSADTTCGFWWDTDSGSPYANNQSVGTIANTSTFNYNASSLTPGQLYYYKAWANNSAGYNTTANELIFLTKPNAPNNLHAQTNNSQTIYITWTKGNGANNTYIEYNTTTSIWLRGQGIMIYNDTGTNYEHTGLDSGTKYYYQAWSYTTWDALHKWSDMNESGNNITWYAPSVTNESPINQSIGITLNPTLSIQVNHSNEFIMNITWYWGEDESCPNFIGINSSVNNGTYFMMNDNNFSAKSKTYYWRVTVNDGNGGWTNITFHFKTTGVNKEIISKEKTAYSLEISPDSTILYGFINNTNVTTPIDRNWHYVVLTYEGTTIKLYEDGKLKNSTILIGSIPTNNNDLMFGDRLTGTLDELRVSAVARSQEWINTTYKMTSSPESFITVEKEQNQQYTYLKIKIKNTGSTTIKTQDSTILINGTDRSFIQIQPYLYPLKNTSIFINVSVAGSKRNKFITGNGITKYEGYG